MIIKKIRDLKGLIPKEEWKKRIASVCALQLGIILTLSSIPIGKEERSKKEISLLYCNVLVENFPDGSVKHHFVNDNMLYDYISRKDTDKYLEKIYEYKGISDENFVVSYSNIVYDATSYFEYNEVPETNGQYIFDYKVPYYVMEAIDLTLPENYSIDELYSKNDLKILEEKLNESNYEIKKEKYRIRNLCLINVNDEFMCFDFEEIIDNVLETTNKEDVTKLKEFYYAPCINNKLLNLKMSSGMSVVEEKRTNYSRYDKNFIIEEITSLEQSIYNDLYNEKIQVENIRDYLTEEQKDSNFITIEEINELLDQLNKKDKKLFLAK